MSQDVWKILRPPDRTSIIYTMPILHPGCWLITKRSVQQRRHQIKLLNEWNIQWNGAADHFQTKLRLILLLTVYLTLTSPIPLEAFLYSEFQYWIFVPQEKQIFVNRVKNRRAVYILHDALQRSHCLRNNLFHSCSVYTLHATAAFLPWLLLFLVLLACTSNKASVFVVKKIRFQYYMYFVLQATSGFLSRDL